MRWKKGQAEIITTTLLIAISVIASSFIISIVQPANYVPVADEPAILEKIDVVQVVKSSDSSFLVGILNTGGYDAVIDAIYVKDPGSNLVRTYQVGSDLPVDGMINVALPTYGQDTSDWIFFEAVTERGNSDTLEISTPIDMIPGSVISSAANLLNVTINGNPITNPGALANLSEVDDSYLNATSLTKTYTGSDSLAVANQTLQMVDGGWSIATVGTDPKYNLHLQMKDGKGAFIFTGRMLLEGFLYQLKLNMSGYLPPGADTYNVTFSFYNQITREWSRAGESGFIQGFNIPVGSGQNNVNVGCIINEAWKYVDYSTGNWSFMFNISVNGNPSNFKINSSNVRLTPLYLENLDGIFAYNITQPSDLSKIQSLAFNVTNFCNVSSMQFLVKIYNYALNGWDILGTFTTPSVPNMPTTFYGVAPGNAISYISADRKVLINIIPANFMDVVFATSFDQASLLVTYDS